MRGGPRRGAGAGGLASCPASTRITHSLATGTRGGQQNS